jgi:hypothetical protein
VSGFSLNKAPFLSLSRLPKLALLRGVRWPPESFSVKLPRWWCSGRGYIGEASFNKRIMLQRSGFLLLLLLSLVGHGGLGKGLGAGIDLQ